MSLQENKQICLRFLESFHEGRFLEEFLAHDATFWSARAGMRERDHFVRSVLAARDLFSKHMKLTVTSMTAEEDRVSIEATGESTLKNGKPYNNTYHFMLVLRDGQIVRLREHCDSALSREALGGA